MLVMTTSPSPGSRGRGQRDNEVAVARPPAGPDMSQEIQHVSRTGWHSKGWSWATEGDTLVLAWPHPQAHDFLDLAGLLLVHVALMEDLGTLLGASLVHLLVCVRNMTLGQCFSMGVSSASWERSFLCYRDRPCVISCVPSTPLLQGEDSAGYLVMIKSAKCAGRGQCHPQVRATVLEDVTASQMTPWEIHGYYFVVCRHRPYINRVQNPIKFKGWPENYTEELEEMQT